VSEASVGSAGAIGSTLFAGVPAEQLEDVLAGLERRRFAVGESLVTEGEQPKVLLLVESGSAEVLVTDRSGIHHTVGLIEPGGTVGEMSLFTGQPASGTVLAVSELVALVLPSEEFERLATAQPAIYRNLGALLAERLARTNRLTFEQQPVEVVVLVEEDGAPPLAGYALACSLAWHSREPTLLLYAADSLPEELKSFAKIEHSPASPPQQARSGRCDIEVRPPGELLAPGVLNRVLEALSSRYAFILVQAREQKIVLPGARAINLIGRNRSIADTAQLSIRAWAEPVARVGPDDDRVLSVPPLNVADLDELQRGLLPLDTPAGRALGWAAREIAGLRVGLAFGAGSLRGYAHLGVMRVFERIRLPLDCVAGTSVGAAVAAMLAAGYTVDRALEVLDEAGRSLVRVTIPTRGFLSSRALRKVVRGLAGDRQLEELPIPIGLVAADLWSGREVVLRTGPCWRAIMASMSIPGIYPAHRIGDHVLVDGGVVNPVPTSVVEAMGAGAVIGIKLSGKETEGAFELAVEDSHERPPFVVPVIVRSLELMQARISRTSSAPTILITPTFPVVSGPKLKNFAYGRALVDHGEEAAEEALPRLAGMLPWLRPEPAP
jgi:NTE family protein